MIAWPTHSQAENLPECERSNLQNPRVCRNAVALFHVDDITWDKVRGVELGEFALSNDLSMLGLQFFQFFECIFCIPFLQHSHDSVDNENS